MDCLYDSGNSFNKKLFLENPKALQQEIEQEEERYFIANAAL
ncbi:MAG: hypothetical protein AAGF04_04250 [Chlamydiota bacterium]